jgi:hypothetical protein
LTDTLAGGSFGERFHPQEGFTVMADRVVIVRSGEHMVSLPFEHIDEILGADRVRTGDDVPENEVLEELTGEVDAQPWVFSRGSWLPVGPLLPGTVLSGSSQIVVVRWGNIGRAFAVDQVLGIEKPGPMADFPERARPFTEVPIAGVRFWKDGPVLELDLSRLISLNSES